ncbi:MAG TPA: GSCFA domain-containing protein [Gammaproteobacteria bacterium]|jgi:hypothetical protein|nr:GSCFA domain-containing protein [Gammaproteobacteria bacterium]
MDCPYSNLAETSYWKNAISKNSDELLNPHLSTKFKINNQLRIASAGSCFAQYISKALIKYNYNYFITEPSPPNVPENIAIQYGYGVFSARYGNIYTPLQMLQLIERACKEWFPKNQLYNDPNTNKFFDLLRPRIMPNGFTTELEYENDLEYHLIAVKKLFSETDIFIFTLGLTEAWLSKIDGTVYPTCPGCGNPGKYDPDKYFYHNFNIYETINHLNSVIVKLTQINPNVQIILTVSPIPLVATMENRHILQASIYSKSILRIAVEEAIKNYSNVHYFASYELISANVKNYQYFNPNQRNITDLGIEHVMKCFFQQFTDMEYLTRNQESSINTDFKKADTNKTVCDEEDFFRAFNNFTVTK